MELKTDYNNLENYDRVFISKAFTDTPFDNEILKLPNVEYGGTGFFWDKAPDLPYEIEHSMPDYHLYDDFVNDRIAKGESRNRLYEYTDLSIGFLTRGCFRKCEFCVNKKYNHVFVHSHVKEFYDPTRPKICLLDDNFLGCQKWRELLQELIDTRKAFRFKQGLDERLLTDEICEMLFSAKTYGEIFFAFDNVEDAPIIEEKLKMINRHTDKWMVFYVLIGFDKNNRYDEDFWVKDIDDAFKRIEILMRYNALPYITKYYKYNESPWKGVYTTLARWTIQKNMFKKLSLREFCLLKGNTASYNYMNELCTRYPQFERYMDLKLTNMREVKQCSIDIPQEDTLF